MMNVTVKTSSTTTTKGNVVYHLFEYEIQQPDILLGNLRSCAL